MEKSEHLYLSQIISVVKFEVYCFHQQLVSRSDVGPINEFYAYSTFACVCHYSSNYKDNRKCIRKPTWDPLAALQLNYIQGMDHNVGIYYQHACW